MCLLAHPEGERKGLVGELEFRWLSATNSRISEKCSVTLLRSEIGFLTELGSS